MSEAVTTEKYFNVSVPVAIVPVAILPVVIVLVARVPVASVPVASVPVASVPVAQPVFIKAIQHTLYETEFFNLK